MISDAPLTFAWIAEDAPRMEVARVQRTADCFLAEGTQLGATYELRYRLAGDTLQLTLAGEGVRVVELADDDFFDLAYSPLFNSLPVIRDGLLEPGSPRTYVMRWVDVPSLEVHRSEQEYEPLGQGLVRFRADNFTADIQFDADGFVLEYPRLARRV